MKRIIGRIDPNDQRVVIWGAGISGLVLGYYLKSQGYKVLIHEKSNHIGGKIRTKRTGAGLVETGANALFMNADVMDLLKELKLEPLPAAKKLKRYLIVNGKFKKPFQVGILLKILMNGNKKPPLVSDGLTVAEFFKPLLGKEKIDNFLSPVLGGIYATGAENLHFKSLFDSVSHISQFNSYWEFIKKFKKINKQPKLDVKGSVSFDGGMQTLINRLGEVLKHDIRLNSKEKFRLQGNTIICTDAISAAELLSETLPTWSSELARIKYQELSSTTVFMKREVKSLTRSFGALIPQNSGFNAIGILNNKAIFPENNQNVFAYTFISPKELTQGEIESDMKKIMPDFSTEDVLSMEMTDWQRGIPRYDLNRYLAVKKLHQLAKDQGQLAIFGNYVAGISIREMVTAARTFASNPTEYPKL